MPELDFVAYSAIFVALALGGTMKGATGMGMPVIAIPVMAVFFDVRLAVVLTVLPNAITNTLQLWQYRARRLEGNFTRNFAIAGFVGAVMGSVLLAYLPTRALTAMVAVAVVLYIGLRLLKPDFKIPLPMAEKLCPWTGTISGILQGAAGISAPVSVSFLNAMRLERLVFIPTISVFFLAMTFAQLPVQIGLGLMTLPLALLSLFALVPLILFMPVGAWLSRSFSPQTFDRLTLMLLAGMAVKLIFDVLH